MPNFTTTQKLMGLLPLHVGMRVILSESIAPPHLVTGTPGVIVGIECDPAEPPIHCGPQSSLRSHGAALLHYLPLCVYFRADDFDEELLPRGQPCPLCAAAEGHDPGPAAVVLGAPDPGNPAATPGDPHPCRPGSRGFCTACYSDVRGVIAVEPVTRTWRWDGGAPKRPGEANRTMAVQRRQIPLLPERQGTLHSVQGRTTEPGLIAHWSFPKKLGKESLWLATYVLLSRVRSLAALISHGLPNRDILEAGPPEEYMAELANLFEEKIAATRAACEVARRELRWPLRGD